MSNAIKLSEASQMIDNGLSFMTARSKKTKVSEGRRYKEDNDDHKKPHKKFSVDNNANAKR